jgi:glucose-1-phosphate adenylyltransferase
MDQVIGVINLVNEPNFLKGLTHHRCFASVPFGGRYRLIDFTLSSLIHANVSKVAVFTKEKYRSLMDHLGSGKEWDLDRHNGGLYILPPVDPEKKMKGDIQQFYHHLEFFRRSDADTVIISPGHHVCKIDFNEVLKVHRTANAHLTVVYNDYRGEPVRQLMYHKLSVNEEGSVTKIELYTSPHTGDHICLETYVIDKHLLIDLVQECIENEEFDFLKDAVKANLNRLNVTGFHFKDYMPFIHSVESFYHASMAFLDPEVSRRFFFEQGDVYTKIKNEAPAKYAPSSKVSNALIANGCDIQGIVENSIIFRGVKIKKGAVVKNSIIMQKGEIEEGASVENVITDKQVRITNKKVVSGSGQPKIIKKATII